ncbi:MAG TPA: hypothetical protein VND91_11770, partial [Candidatus Saccharimonadia bacterium]|nr:hypothetical protein [Candidatus Saccharimonadia bacterium]
MHPSRIAALIRGDERVLDRCRCTDQRPHGGWHDLARAPQRGGQSGWVAFGLRAVTGKSPANALGFLIS